MANPDDQKKAGTVDATHDNPSLTSAAPLSQDLTGTWFISDLHLHAGAPEVCSAMWQFFSDLSDQATEHPNSIAELYLLGDLFEAWVGDDDSEPLSMEFATYCAHLASLGVHIFIQHGNRDFLIGEGFAKRCKAILLPETHVALIENKKTLLMHGDELCTDDVQYQRLRAQLRSKHWRQEFLAQDISIRKIQAEKYREASTAAQADKPQSIMDVNDETTMHFMRQNEVTRLIHGHTHRPAIHRYTAQGDTPFRIRCVLGDWSEDAFALHQHKGQIALKKWPLTGSVRNAIREDYQPWTHSSARERVSPFVTTDQ
jgi:UDP-2,3-diacylglucosamine hydrolase